jgi:FMN-dependent NADH-azoreductase
VSSYLVKRLAEAEGANPILERDLVKQPLPPLSPEDLVGVHGSHDGANRPSLAKQLELSNELIAELKESKTIVFGLSMYNFSVPSYLKQWIDYVCRAGVTFRYTSQGPEGLTGVERAFIVTASGGTPVGGAADFASTYLEHICRFLGIGAVYHIDASGSKRKPEEVIAEAKAQVDQLISQA